MLFFISIIISYFVKMEAMLCEAFEKYAAPSVRAFTNSDLHSGYNGETAVFDKDTVACFLCPACFLIPKVPVAFSACGHIMCDCCFLRLCRARFANLSDVGRSQQLTCPLCRHEHTPDAVKHFSEWDPLLIRIYNSIRVLCTNGSCKWKGTIREMEHHEIFLCKKRVVQCPTNGCNFESKADQMPSHLLKCPNLQLYHDCGLPVVAAQFERHDCLREMSHWARVAHHCTLVKALQPLEGLTMGEKGKPIFRKVYLSIHGLHQPVFQYLYAMRKMYTKRPTLLERILTQPTPLSSPVPPLSQASSFVAGEAGSDVSEVVL